MLSTCSKLGNAETQDRTGDLQIFGLTLSRLSYRGLDARFEIAVCHVRGEMQVALHEHSHSELCLDICGAMCVFRFAGPCCCMWL